VPECEAQRLQVGESAIRRADRARDVPGQRQIGAIEHEVPGDERTARADRHGPGREMQRGRAVVRLPGGIAQTGRQAGETAAPHRFERPALRRPCRGFVEEHGQPQRCGDRAAGGVGDGDRVGHRRRPERDERQHVQRADARVHTGVRAEVDFGDGGRGKHGRGARDVVAVAGEGEHRAMVGPVGGAIEQRGAGAGDGRREAIEAGRIASLADVGDGFDQRRTHVPARIPRALDTAASFVHVLARVDRSHR
jgi:hypothetical protein